MHLTRMFTCKHVPGLIVFTFQTLGVPNFVNSQNSINFASEESFECNALQNAEIRTVAISLPTF